jgi:hypothetical protein
MIHAIPGELVGAPLCSNPTGRIISSLYNHNECTKTPDPCVNCTGHPLSGDAPRDAVDDKRPFAAAALGAFDAVLTHDSLYILNNLGLWFHALFSLLIPPALPTLFNSHSYPPGLSQPSRAHVTPAYLSLFAFIHPRGSARRSSADNSPFHPVCASKQQTPSVKFCEVSPFSVDNLWTGTVLSPSYSERTR